ncbi:MAG: hypothetical protein KJ063_11630 [Anaerolineae bacterium]|nr:hypothetical protein [Anaerolineae bacterium]
MNHHRAPSPKRPLLFRVIGYFLLLLSLILAFYGLVVGLAISNGQKRGVVTQLTVQADQLARQMTLAQEDYSRGNYELALTRLDWVLQQNRDYPGAAALHRQTQAELAQQNPTATATIPATPTPSPTPTLTPQPIVNPTQELAALRQMIQNEGWDEAIPRLIAFQTQFPNESRDETDRMLYEAYIGLGLRIIYTDQIELGIYYLDLAENLGTLPQAVQDQRSWGELYVAGIAFYQVNWDVSAYYFRQLCAAAPFFHDACGKYYISLVSYGDQFAGMFDWCPAEIAYREALPYGNTQTLRDKLNSAITGCLQATPTPSAVITDTAPITDTIPFTNTLPSP